MKQSPPRPTFQLWWDNELQLSGCLSIQTCKRHAAKCAYNESVADRKQPTFFIRTDEGQLLEVGQWIGRRMKWVKSPRFHTLTTAYPLWPTHYCDEPENKTG